MRKVKDEIRAKNEQIALLEKQIEESLISSHSKMDSMEISEVSLAFALMDWLNSFDFVIYISLILYLRRKS